MTRDLLEMADWLAAEGVTNVAMESTGVFWKPIFNILQGRFTVLLVNARHLKQVPGRKSDVRDCQWIAQLLQCGLLKGSFIPSRARARLRCLEKSRWVKDGLQSDFVENLGPRPITLDGTFLGITDQNASS